MPPQNCSRRIFPTHESGAFGNDPRFPSWSIMKDATRSYAVSACRNFGFVKRAQIGSLRIGNTLITERCNSEPRRALGIKAPTKLFQNADIKSSLTGCRSNTHQGGFDGNSTFLRHIKPWNRSLSQYDNPIASSTQYQRVKTSSKASPLFMQPRSSEVLIIIHKAAMSRQ